MDLDIYIRIEDIPNKDKTYISLKLFGEPTPRFERRVDRHTVYAHLKEMLDTVYGNDTSRDALREVPVDECMDDLNYFFRGSFDGHPHADDYQGA